MNEKRYVFKNFDSKHNSYKAILLNQIMGSVNIKMRFMPASPETDLEKIKEKAKKLIEENEGKGTKFEEEPIAFGLKAIIMMFIWPEEKEFESIENKLGKIENVNSVRMVDMRRAI